MFTKENSLDALAVCERYDVCATKLMRTVWKRRFPSPWRVFGEFRWLKSDLELFDEWILAQNKAAANGRDPNEIARPEFSLPFDGPMLDRLNADR